MTVARNGDFNILDFTQSVELVPRIANMIGELGLFDTPVMGMTTVAQVERIVDGLDEIQARERGGERNYMGRENAIVRNFNTPLFPLDTRITAKEFQDLRKYGTDATAPKQLQDVVDRVLMRARKSHSNTLMKSMYAALKGASYSPSWSQGQYDYFAEFGVAKKSFAVDFTEDEVDPRITVEREARKHIIDNAQDDGQAYKVIALVGSGFFNSLITHPQVQAAYDSYPSQAEPLRNRLGGDLISRSFDTSGVTYIEDISGQVANADAYFVPLGISGMFTMHYAPADSKLYANQEAQEMYVFLDDSNHRTEELETETSVICVNSRPELVPVATGNTLRF